MMGTAPAKDPECIMLDTVEKKQVTNKVIANNLMQ